MLFFGMLYFFVWLKHFFEFWISTYLVGDDLPGVPKKQKIIENKISVCHPELVEVFLSEERGKTKAPKRRRDLAQNLGGFWKRCYIFFGKPPKFVRRSHPRCRSSVLHRIVACGSLPQQNFDFVQDDMQKCCFIVFVKSWRSVNRPFYIQHPFSCAFFISPHTHILRRWRQQ